MQNLHNAPASTGIAARDVTAVILAGGRSRRMGRDKATLRVAGERLFDRTLRVVRTAIPAVLIAGDRPDLAGPGVPCFPDPYPGSALGGIHCGLAAAPTPWILVVPCDLPHPDAGLIRLLLAAAAGYDCVIPRTARGLEPVFALYHRNCLPPVAAMLQRGDYRIFDLFPLVRVRYLDLDPADPRWRRALLNVNTPRDLDLCQENPTMMPPVVSIVAKSGTGKTTLLEKLIAELAGRGYRVGAVKHDAHSFSIDHEGKDSWRLTRAGAETMLITSPAKIAMVRANRDQVEPPLAETIANYCAGMDIVLTEGFKRSAMPKIEVHRRERSATLLCRGEEYDPTLIAVASDSPLDLDVPLFDLNDAAGLADFVVARFLA